MIKLLGCNKKWNLLAITRNFSRMEEIKKYSLKKHLKNYLEKQKEIVLGNKSAILPYEKQKINYMERPLDKAFYPMQHPEKLDYKDKGIISYKPKPRNLAEFYKLPSEAIEFKEEPFESPIDSKCLDVCILGLANAGKSLLLNNLVGRTVSAVSPKYNTTTETSIGIYTEIRDKIQLNIFDTPGAIRVGNNEKGSLLETAAWDTIVDCDKVLFVVDCLRTMNSTLKDAIKRLRNTTRSAAEQLYLDRIKANRDDKTLPTLEELNQELAEIEEIDEDNPSQISTVLLLNKVDLATDKEKLKTLQREIEDIGQFEKTMIISAKTGYGIDELKKYLLESAKTRPWNHNPKTKSLQSEADKALEIMRQEIFKHYWHEIPYNVNVKLVSWVPRTNGELILDYQLDAQHKTQVKMLLGKRGRIMEEVKAACTAELCKLLGRPVKINVAVTVSNKKR